MIPVLIQSVNMLFSFLQMLLFARIIFSWLSMAMGPNALFRLVYNLTEPMLVPIRGMIARSPLGGPGMAMDFSVLFLFLILPLTEQLVISLLLQFS